MVFRDAPVRQLGDSQYSMLLAANLLRHGDFQLERYANLPKEDYRIQTIDGHRYYSFPPGTSVLSVPFVALMRYRGVSAVAPDGSYNVRGEMALDAKLAELVMAGFAVLVYFTARILLPVRWSVLVTCICSFGTQVFSTTSRSMWSDTWGICLVGCAVFLLLRSVAQARRLNLPLLASVEALSYIVRPTNSIVLVATAVYIAMTSRRELWKFLLTAAGWLVVFVAYSWLHFQRLLPDYYAPGRLRFYAPASAFFGSLVSPSRGLLVNVPAVVAVAILIARYHKAIRFRALAGVAGSVFVGHMIMLAGFEHWWGGHCYGARLTASLVPWTAITAILAVDALRSSSASGRRVAGALLHTLASVLCVASIIINTIGAYSFEAAKWNVTPENIDKGPFRLWSWGRPQFLAPFIEPEGSFALLPPEGLRVGSSDAEPYLGLGWAYGEGDFRWTDKRATIRFLRPPPGSELLVLDLRPYLVAGQLEQQQLTVSMNGEEVATFNLRDTGFQSYRIQVPAAVIKSKNVLLLRLPDAASPAKTEGRPDTRRLGAAVRDIRWVSSAGI
jgi:hypothetical protein